MEYKMAEASTELKFASEDKDFDIEQGIGGKKILFLVDIFPPHFAPRVLSIIRYFVSMSAECTVFTEEIPTDKATAHGAVFDDIEDPCTVFRLKLRKRYNKAESIRQALWEVKDRLFARLVEGRVRVADYDLIIAFAYRNFPLSAALALAQRYKKPLLCDCRDIVEQYSGYSFFPGIPDHPSLLYRMPLRLLRKRISTLRNRVLRHANAITTVSPWHEALLSKATEKKEVYCLYNGYDESIFSPKHNPTERFQIVFTGRIMSLGMRNPSLLFEALESKELEPLTSGGELEVFWYTDPHSRMLLQKVLERYSTRVKAVQRFHNMVTFSHVGEVLQGASIILLLGNKESKEGPHGIVSTKIFEAMAMEKPILALPDDEAICAKLIATSRSGTSTSKIDEVKRFLRDWHEVWRKNGYTCIPNADRHFVEQFNRTKIATSFARLSEGLIK